MLVSRSDMVLQPLRAHPEFLSTDGTADSHRNKRQRHSLLAEEHDTSALPAQVIQSKNAEATSPTSLSALNNRKHSLSEVRTHPSISLQYLASHLLTRIIAIRLARLPPSLLPSHLTTPILLYLSPKTISVSITAPI